MGESPFFLPTILNPGWPKHREVVVAVAVDDDDDGALVCL